MVSPLQLILLLQLMGIGLNNVAEAEKNLVKMRKPKLSAQCNFQEDDPSVSIKNCLLDPGILTLLKISRCWVRESSFIILTSAVQNLAGRTQRVLASHGGQISSGIVELDCLRALPYIWLAETSLEEPRS